MTSIDAEQSGGRPSDELAAARLARRVRKQWLLIVACALVAAVIGFVASATQAKQYQATTTVELNDIDLASVFLAQNLQQPGQDAPTKVATAAKLATLPSVLQVAARSLGSGTTVASLQAVITVAPQIDTTLVDITAKAGSPRLAAARANAVRTAFIASRQQSTSAQLVTAKQRVEADFDALTDAQKRSANGVAQKQRLDQLDTLIATAGAGVRTVQVAAPPTAAVSPRPKRDAILALIVGGLIGFGAALLRARLDDRVADVDELDELWELPLLGLIPQSPGLGTAGAGLPPAVAVEAFALARTNLRYLRVGNDVRTIVVTSALPGEGKSTVAWNVALAGAMVGQRVLVVEADLRRPVLAERLHLAPGRGFSELLAGLATTSDVVRQVSVPVPGSDDVRVDVIPAGFVPPSPLALLERDSTSELLRELAEGYELVILDTPPAAAVADAKVLLEYADGALVVSRLGRLTRAAAVRLRETLQGIPTPVLGRVVNSGDASGAYGYDYGYSARPAVAQQAPASGAAAEPVERALDHV